MATQHAALPVDRWRRFSLDQQLVMIANEWLRTGRMTGEDDAARRRNGHERVLALVDLTVACRPRAALLRELLRWRDLVAERYLDGRPDDVRHRQLLRALLRLDRIAARQIPHVAP